MKLHVPEKYTTVNGHFVGSRYTTPLHILQRYYCYTITLLNSSRLHLDIVIKVGTFCFIFEENFKPYTHYMYQCLQHSPAPTAHSGTV